MLIKSYIFRVNIYVVFCIYIKQFRLWNITFELLPILLPLNPANIVAIIIIIIHIKSPEQLYALFLFPR